MSFSRSRRRMAPRWRRRRRRCRLWAIAPFMGSGSVHGGNGNGGSNGHLPNAPAAAPSTAAPVNGMIRIVARPAPPDDPSIVTSDHVAVLDPSRLRSDEYAINGSSSNGSSNGSHHGTSYAPVSLVTLFTSKPLRQRLPPMLFAWASTSFSYYGLSLDSSNLGASLHLNFALMSAIEIPAILIGAVLIEWPPLGRRYTLAGGFALGGIACIICAVLSGKDEDAGDDDGIGPIQLSALAGKFAIAATFAIVFPYTAELFPHRSATAPSACARRARGLAASPRRRSCCSRRAAPRCRCWSSRPPRSSPARGRRRCRRRGPAGARDGGGAALNFVVMMSDVS